VSEDRKRESNGWMIRTADTRSGRRGAVFGLLSQHRELAAVVEIWAIALRIHSLVQMQPRPGQNIRQREIQLVVEAGLEAGHAFSCEEPPHGEEVSRAVLVATSHVSVRSLV